MKEGCDESPGGWSDLKGAPIKVDRVVVMDLSRGAEGEVEIEQGRGRARPQVVRPFARGFFKDEAGNQLGGCQAGIILAGDFHLKDFIGWQELIDLGVSQESHHAVLKGSKAPLDLAFGLGRGGHQMSHSQGLQSALKLASGVAVVVR